MIKFTKKKKVDDGKDKFRTNCKLVDSDEEPNLDINDFETIQLWKKPIKKNDGTISKGAVIKSLYLANGVPTVAARALGVCRKTLMKWVDKHEDIKAAFDDARNCTADFAENKLIECLERRHEWAINLALKYRSNFNDQALEAEEKANNRGSILDAVENMLDEEE